MTPAQVRRRFAAAVERALAKAAHEETEHSARLRAAGVRDRRRALAASRTHAIAEGGWPTLQVSRYHRRRWTVETVGESGRVMNPFMKLTSAYAILVGLRLAPPVFDRAFAMLHLPARERPWLWIAAVGFITAGLYCRFGRWRPVAVAFVLLNCLVLTTTELVARLAIRRFAPDRQAELSRWGDATYNDLLAYQGHPVRRLSGSPARVSAEVRAGLTDPKGA